MRREMKLGIAVLVVMVAGGAWLYNMGGLRQRGEQPGVHIADNLEPVTDTPSAPPRDMTAEAPPAAPTDSVAAGSPAPVAGPDSQERSIRPRPIEASPPTPPTSERLGLSDSSEIHPSGPSVPPAPAVTMAPPPAELPHSVTSESPSPKAAPAPVIGPMPAPTAAAPAGPAPAEKAAEKIHVVQTGDTFNSMAQKYYGSTRHARLIATANPNIDPRRLHVGAKIKIPPAPAASPAGDSTTKPSATTAAPPVPPERAYTVKAGESWNDLGKRFLGSGSRWVEIYELNKERVPRNINTLPAGTVLELPAEALAKKTQ